jgi:hypothetical protein
VTLWRFDDGRSPVIRYRRGELILFVGMACRPMTAWITGEPGDESISTEAGFQAEPTSAAFARTRVVGAQATPST